MVRLISLDLTHHKLRGYMYKPASPAIDQDKTFIDELKTPRDNQTLESLNGPHTKHSANVQAWVL